MTPRGRPGVPSRALLVDLDDTLFDHRAAYQAGLERVRAVFPALARTPRARLYRRYRELLERVHPSVVRGDVAAADSRRDRFRTLFEEAGAVLSHVQIEQVLRVYTDGYRSNQTPVRGARTLLARLRPRWQIVVITNHVRSEQLPKLEELRLRPLVDAIVAADDAGVLKPDPAFLRRALRVAGVTAPRAVVLGDSWKTDVQGALAAGIRPVWLNRAHEEPPQAGVDELPSLVPVTRTVAMIERDLP